MILIVGANLHLLTQEFQTALPVLYHSRASTFSIMDPRSAAALYRRTRDASVTWRNNMKIITEFVFNSI